MIIGGKIRRLRMELQLTQEELADRTELTKGYISQVERDLASPSIATLVDILEALGTTLGEFFADEKKDEKIVFQQEDVFIKEEPDYDMTIRWIIPNAQKNEMEPILIELDKQKQSMIIDPHEGQEFGYVVQGKIKLIYGDNEFILKKGETFYLKGLVSHYIVNPSETRAKVIWVSTPPLF